MPRKGENIYKRKDGRWEARYIRDRTESGKAVYGYVYAKSYYEVKRKVTKQIEQKNLVSIVKRSLENEECEFQIFAEKWLASVKLKVKESTYIKYRNILYLYIYPYYKNISYNSISYQDLIKFREELLAKGGRNKTGLSVKTVTDIFSVLKNIFHYSEQCGYPSPCNLKGIVKKQTLKEPRVLSYSEQTKLYQYLCKNLNYKNLGVLICFYTGIRIGEICALQWEDISLQEKTLNVCHTLQRIQTLNDPYCKTKIIVSVPKSDCSKRIIPLPDTLVEIIKLNHNDFKGYILTGSESKYVEPRTMENHLKKVLRECGIKNITFHALRHTFATRCIEAGVDVKSLSEMLGHASVNITMNRYVHPSMEMKRKNIEKYSALFAVK